jgi:hypothetical protein
MDRAGILRQWRTQLDAIERLGGEIDELVLDEPATEAEVARVEGELGVTLPPVMRNSFLTFARGISVGWSLPDGFQLPEPVEQAIGGEITYSLDDIVDSELQRRDWADDVIASWEMPEESVTWENKIAFLTLGNGDFLAVDVSTSGREPVVYLSHDGDEYVHCYVLGSDFDDFLTRWTGVGCPSPDNIEPFTHDFTKPLDPDCENAVLWRKAVGLS